jgi:VCBS repeat-containing protein
MVNDDHYSIDEDEGLTVVDPGLLGNDSDDDGDPLTATIDAQPSNGSVVLNSDGSFTYSPNANFNGTDSFTYRANDGTEDSLTAMVTISVNPVNDPPVAADDDYSTDEDSDLTILDPGVLTNDSDVEGDSLTASIGSTPSNGTLVMSSDGSFTYSPDPNFNGTDSFTYRAGDGTDNSNVATVIMTVNPVNDPPVAVDDAYSTDEDTVLTITAPGVLASDSDVEGDSLNASIASTPSHGTLSLSSDGSFSYSPSANFNGTDSFTYRAGDGIDNSNVATVTIIVNPINDPPVAVDDAYSTDEDTDLTVSAPGVLDNDSDIEPGSLSAFLISDVSNGSLTLNTDGSFSYSPSPNFNGTDSFTYFANDSKADSNIATVEINVKSPIKLDMRISTSTDDAEERENGRVRLTSSDLEMVLDKDVQKIGLRFNEITIPQGANITYAYIQFKADESHSGETTLTFHGQAVGNTLTFVNSSKNISNRTLTIEKIEWKPDPWAKGESGPNQRTPNIASIIKAIVDLEGWSPGNSLVIIITGTGKRVAESYNGDQAGAPLLHVEYTIGN